MRSKKTIDVSYKDVEDKVFKLKEAEKYNFTDKLKDMSDEARAVDTILKHHKLGPLYSLGMSKGIKEYDPEHFEYDKKIAENVAKLQSKLRQRGQDDEMDLEDTYDDNYVDAEDIPYTTVMIDNAMYLVDPTTDEVTDQNDKVVTGKDKNRILANYYSTANKLKSASLGDKLFYVIGTKIINQDFTDAKLNGDQRKNLIIMDFNITIC
jgi:hypothetical protein